MKQLTLAAITMMALSASSLINAQTIKSRHSVGIQFGGGGLEYKGKDTDGQGVGNSYLYYNYQVMPGFYIETGFVGAEDVDDWQCDNASAGDIKCYSDDSDDFEIKADNFDFGSLIVAVKGELKVSKRNAFYAKIGAEFYDYQFKLDRIETVDEDGTGLYIEAGWQYRWDSGVGVNAGLQAHNLGDLDLNTFNIGVSYAF